MATQLVLFDMDPDGIAADLEREAFLNVRDPHAPTTPADWTDENGRCYKCHGTGIYRFGAVVNGRATKSGTCFACRGTGLITQADAKRNDYYWDHRPLESF